MKSVEDTYGVRKLESRLRSTGKSIIEDWQNSAEHCDEFFRNKNHYYEERAIDVGPDFTRPMRSSQTQRSSRVASSTFDESSKKNSRDDAVHTSRKEKPNQSNATVRSIPIKDYRASLVHDMETLRRSVLPQRQFESLISEPERNPRLAGKRRSRRNIVSTSPRAEKSFTSPKTRLSPVTRRSKNRRSFKSMLDRSNKNRTIEFVPSFRFLDEPSEFHADSGFHSRRTSSRRRGRRTPSREDTQAVRAASSEAQPIENAPTRSARDSSEDLNLGNVCKKISVYEGNARSSGRSERETAGRGLDGNPDVKRHRAIGVPLVGMHNACGLPVIAHWPERRVFSDQRLPVKIVSERRVQTSVKRKAPQPRNLRGENDEALPASDVIDESTGSATSKRVLKRPSFKAGRTNPMPYKQRYSRRNGARTTSQDGRKVNGGTLRNGNSTRQSTKRSTLYARDEGNEAVEALANLCLNPLARNKGAANMIW